MKEKKGFFPVFVLLILLSVTSSYARDYWLESADIKAEVYENGIFHVEEKILYSFDGDFTEVYRQIFPPEDGSITNMSGMCQDNLCTFEVRKIPKGYELAGVLAKPTPKHITFIVSYDYLNSVKTYTDVSELHYKIWGDEWEKPVRLNAEITLPSDNITYYLHPEKYATNHYTEKNKVYIKADIPSNRYFEIRAVIPKLENAVFSKNFNITAGDEIKKIERIYKIQNIMTIILSIILLIIFIGAIIFPVIIYLIHGREPKIPYYGLYERELPTRDKPSVVNLVMKGRFVSPTIDGFTATILDLVNKKYILMEQVKTKATGVIFKREIDDLKLSFTRRPLDEIEQDAYDFLLRKAGKNQVLWSELKKELSKGTDFFKFMNEWGRKVKSQIDVKKMFIPKGNTIIIISYALLAFLCFFVFPFLNIFINSSSLASIMLGLSMLLGFWCIFLIIFAILAPRFFGRFTPKGMVYYKKWKNFEKYITDFSLLREHPPTSIVIWEHYLVYATALGVAERVIENMKLLAPKEFEKTSLSTNFFITGFHSAYSSSAPRSSGSGGSVGGVGGGFGGGGGGAR